MYHLRITPVRTTSRLRGAANAADLADEHRVEDGYVIVETQAEADELLSHYSNLELELNVETDGDEDDDAADDTAETCQAIKGDGDVCGRELPCPYHSDDDSDDDS